MSDMRKTDVGNPAHWLEFAQDDLAAVRLLASAQTSYWVARGKLAEAFEKAIKADLIRHGWRLEKTHDLQRLLDELIAFDSNAVQLQPFVDELAESYTESRYPGFDLDAPDWRDLDRLMTRVSQYVSDIQKHLPA